LQAQCEFSTAAGSDNLRENVYVVNSLEDLMCSMLSEFSLSQDNERTSGG